MRLIADGVVDREGVDGLARRLAYSPRQLRRLLRARARRGAAQPRARAARADRPYFSSRPPTCRSRDVAFAAGFASLRQFNDTVREVFARSPRELRAKSRAARGVPRPPGEMPTREAMRTASITSPRSPCACPYREPFDARGLLRFFAARAVPGIEEVDGDTLRRTIPLPHGVAVAELTLAHEGHAATKGGPHVDAVLQPRRPARPGGRREPLPCTARPGRRPARRGRRARRRPAAGAARRAGARADAWPAPPTAPRWPCAPCWGSRSQWRRRGRPRLAWSGPSAAPLAQPIGALTHAFPTAEALAEADPALLPMPASRARTIRALARAIAERRLELDPGADRDETRRRLLELPGVGPWTASYIAMRALADTDAFPATDLGMLRGLAALGGPARSVSSARPLRALAPLARLRRAAPLGSNSRRQRVRLRDGPAPSRYSSGDT